MDMHGEKNIRPFLISIHIKVYHYNDSMLLKKRYKLEILIFIHILQVIRTLFIIHKASTIFLLCKRIYSRLTAFCPDTLRFSCCLMG